MSGDYSRFTYDPRRRFAGVQMQQGRVQLDSDWNEQTELLRERTRLLGLDVGGPAWLPALTTPNAFLIGVIAGPDLSIEPGRIYVDGRLAEIFPGEGITYLNQPFFPDPPAFNPAAGAIVYLDLWEREVSWAEEPQLLDVALGGVDTTTRVQQVWQVRLLQLPGTTIDCGFDLNALNPPSGGRLTTSAVAPPAPDDPCILPPNAGYRGIENRLYRVEVQQGGAVGTATFKWSRDNGSIVSRVGGLAVAGGQSRITVNRIGRDEALRFRIDDWVTLTDDHREFHGEAGQMARIVDIDEAARVVVLDRVVPAAGGRPFGATAVQLAERNTRLQRWDQSAPLNGLNADGVMTTAAGPVGLEDGVQVGFSVSPAGGAFKVGDYWVFAARTADASVEELNQAPPRGISHQYLQLAAIPAGGPAEDCRPKPPVQGEGCCTIVVAPGESIQQAFTALPPEGGCVCLKAGLHVVGEPIVLQRDNVTLHGESLGAIVVNTAGTTVLVIEGAQHGRVHDIVFRQGEAGAGAGTGTVSPALAQPVITIDKVEDLAIEDCRLEPPAARAGSIGIFAVAASGLVLSSLHVDGAALGVWLDRDCESLVVRGCRFDMAEAGPDRPDTIAILAREIQGFLTAEDNLIIDAVNGIILNDHPDGMPDAYAATSRIAGNRIYLVRSPIEDDQSYGIDCAAEASLVLANHIQHDGGLVTGIRLCGSGSSACQNVVAAELAEVDVSVAIVAGLLPYDENDKPLPLAKIVIADNVIVGSQHGVDVIDVAGAEISGNLLGWSGVSFGGGIILLRSTDCLVSSNVIQNSENAIFTLACARNAYRDNQIEGGEGGIGIWRDDSPSVTGNRLTGLSKNALGLLQITQRCDVVGNRISRCGWDNDVAVSIIAIQVSFGEWHVESNEVTDTGLEGGEQGAAAPIAYGIFGAEIQEARIESNSVGYSDLASRNPDNEDRALLLGGTIDAKIDLAAGSIRFGFAAQIIDNKFTGTGASALVQLVEAEITDNVWLRFERVMYSGNFCWHLTGRPSNQGATVVLAGGLCTVSGNQVKANTLKFPSYHLNGMPGPFVGNISAGPVLGRPPAMILPAPQNAFNFET